MLRWLVLATAVPAGGSLGGVVRYTTELISALGRRDDVEVHALVTKPAAAIMAELTGDARRVHTLPVQLPGSLSAAVERVYRPSGRAGFDVVHGVKHVVPRSSRALRVLTVHDMLLLDRAQDFPGLKQRLLPGPYLRSLADSDLPVCVSAATRERLRAYLPAAADRAAVVPLAPAEVLCKVQAESVPVLAGKRFALVVGDASPRKNVATLISAWRQVREVLPDAVLAIAGPPDWSGSPVDAERSQLLGFGAVQSLGHVSDAQLRWCYEHARVVLCPSLAEGFGLPVAEALSLKAQVIISTDRALQEAAAGSALAIIDPSNVSDWASAIVAALSNDDVRHATAAGLLRSWDDVAAETVAAVRARIQQTKR